MSAPAGQRAPRRPSVPRGPAARPAPPRGPAVRRTARSDLRAVAASLRSGVRAAARASGRPAGLALRPLRATGLGAASLLRRSLQLRVIATTVALGLLTVTVVGLVLGEEISQRLLEGRRTQAIADASRAAEGLQKEFNTSTAATVPDIRALALNIVDRLDIGAGDDVTALLLRPPGTDGFGDITPVRSRATPAVVPPELRRAVRADGEQHVQSIGLPRPGGREDPALVVGQQVQVPIVGAYELYYVLDLSREQATLEAVQRVLLLGALALVVLIGAVAALVARQVVLPVREAAAVAERLAAGDLGQRIPVRGQDDLARLARSFNGMAASIRGQITRLEELGALQQHFVSDVSHELRTPLTTIRMAGELLYESREDFPPALARSAELLQQQVDHFEDLLGDLLEISRHDAGAAVLDLDALDLRDLVAGVVERNRPLAQARSTAVELDLGVAPCVAEVDRRRVERVVRNLLGNALVHGQGRPVVVTVAGDAEAVAVRVRDHGVGLTPAQAARVFDRFWRAEPSRGRIDGPGRSPGGTGLGLAISKEDAQLHHGRLQVWGRPNRGASFVLTLPRRAGTALTSSPLAAAPSGGRAIGPPLDRAAESSPAAPARVP